MKNKDVGFWLVFILSIVLVACSFNLAAQERESAGVGGEVFMTALPVYIVWTKMADANRVKEKLKAEREEYKKALWKCMK